MWKGHIVTQPIVEPRPAKLCPFSVSPLPQFLVAIGYMILAISDFHTAFEIARGSNGIFADACFRLLIGIAALIGGVSALLFKWTNKGLKSWIGPVFAIVWSLFWLYLHNFPHVFGHIDSLVSAYRKRQYQVIEGQVQVLHEQPATGHTKGDIITVNGKQFEVNYFYATPAYRNTIAHGGVLGSGVYARLYYHDGEILRVDIRK
jgi:hypothetical protein